MPEKEKQIIPEHIGIIMDGNRRWAKERNLPSLEGHRKGYEKLRYVPDWFFSKGVKIVSFWAFSTDNWTRSQDEVNYLMKLMKKIAEDDLDEMNQKGFKIIFSGRIDELPGDLPETCYSVMSKTKENTKGIINICLNYGGRPEIVDAVKKMIKNNVEVDQVHEGLIKKYLYNSDLPDPDMIVRTSGEYRLSGFLLWESVYSELLFLKKYWPDFERNDVDAIIDEYNNRERRYGGDSK